MLDVDQVFQVPGANAVQLYLFTKYLSERNLSATHSNSLDAPSSIVAVLYLQKCFELKSSAIHWH